MPNSREKTCRGSYLLGTACGSCLRCHEEAVKRNEINWQKHPAGSVTHHEGRPLQGNAMDLEEKISALTRICGDKDIEIDRLNRTIDSLRKELSESRGLK